MTTDTIQALIVFVDVVEFSKYDPDKQQTIIMSLNAEMSRQLFPHLTRFNSSPSLICMPSGDGMAIVFNRSRCEARDLFSLLRCLMEWSPRLSIEERLDPPCRIRVGVHVGTLSIIADVNRQPNVCGDAINMCRRIMDQARWNQVLFSDQAWDQYLHGCEVYSYFPFSIQKPAKFTNSQQVTAKHNQPLKVRVMFCEGDKHWNDGAPMSVPTVFDGPAAAADRTQLIIQRLNELADSPQATVTIYEQASFSTFSIHSESVQDYGRGLGDITLLQLRAMEELLEKKSTTVKVLLRPIPKERSPVPKVNQRLSALARWMDENLIDDAYQPRHPTSLSRASKVQFRVLEEGESEHYSTGGANRLMIADLVRIDGFRVMDKVGHGLSLVYYEEHKIKEGIASFTEAFDTASRAGQSNEQVRKQLATFRPIPSRPPEPAPRPRNRRQRNAG